MSLFNQVEEVKGVKRGKFHTELIITSMEAKWYS